MTVLSDRDLARIWPESDPGPASIDLHVGDTLLWWPDWIIRDPHTDQSDTWREAFMDGPHSGWLLKPGTRYLATTRERVRIPDDLAGFISARSSWGRDGLAVICGPAGFLDPGFIGNVVLELSVIGSSLVVRPGDSVCQLVVHRMTTPALRPYAGKYQGQDGVTPSRFHEEVPA